MRASLRLFLTSSSPQSREVLDQLDQLRKEYKNLQLDLEIIDVLEDPLSAEKDQISVTPTLVILSPLPVRKLIGDFTNLARDIGLKRS